MNDIQQAREWAEKYQRHHVIGPEDEVAAVEVIQSLPDQIVDGCRLRQIIDFQGTGISDDARKDLESLLPAPPLRTLSDMTPEERDTQKWMQAKVFSTSSTLGIITGVDGYTRSAIILFADGMAKNVPWAFITPLPDLPKLEWPGGGVEDALIAEKRAHQKLRKRIEERIRELKQPLCSHIPVGDELDDYLEQWGRQSHEAEILTRILEADHG